MSWTTALHVILALLWTILRANGEIFTRYTLQKSYADKLCTANFVELKLITFKFGCLATCSLTTKCDAAIFHRNSELCYILRGGYQDEDCSFGLNGTLFYTKDVCPEGWAFLYHSCYRLTADRAIWMDSLIACQSLNKNAHLAYVETKEKNEKLQQWIGNVTRGDPDKDRLWVGARYHHDGWKWEDGRSVYSNWEPSEPNLESNDNCMYIGTVDFRFGDRICKTKYWMNGLCELDMFKM